MRVRWMCVAIMRTLLLHHRVENAFRFAILLKRFAMFAFVLVFSSLQNAPERKTAREKTNHMLNGIDKLFQV